ncbi:hypothetical protein HID58_023948, partial [Brassica napus]
MVTEDSSPKETNPTTFKLIVPVIATTFGGGCLFMSVHETINSRNAQDTFYTEARAMLLKLGLEGELQELNIPPGARLLILDHIKRFVYKLLYSYMDQRCELDPTILCCLRWKIASEESSNLTL